MADTKAGASPLGERAHRRPHPHPVGWPRLRVGDQLGRYTLCQFLGSGGMGRVYRAQGPDGEVALKLIHPQYLKRDDFLRRFLLESGAGKRIRHPNVVRTHGLEVVPHGGHEQAMLVMEYVPGRTLLDLQTDLGKLPDGFLRTIAEGLVAGLEAIHRAGVIHRDLKPENIMLSADHRVKIMDLGVAKLREDEVRLSRTGHFVGSLLFAAPEQLTDGGAACGPSTDLYAAGLVLYVLATGSHPFPSGTAGEIITAHLHKRPAGVRTRAPDVSPFLEAVIDVLLAKTPGERFPSAAELLDTLQLAESSPWWLDRQQADKIGRAWRPRLDVSREHPLRGRGAALRGLTGWWRDARRGLGSLILLEGEAGIGKTRVVDALLDLIEIPAASVVTLEPTRETSPLSSLELAGRIHPDGDAASMPSHPEPGALAVAVDARTQGEPLLILIDRPTQVLRAPAEQLAELGSLAAQRPLLVLVMSRPAATRMRDACLSAPRASVFPLGPLLPRAARQLLQDRHLAPSLLQSMGDMLIQQTGGHPFMLVELIESMKSRRLLRQRSDGLWERADHHTRVGLPASVRALLERRLIALDHDGRRRLQAASVQGVEVDIALLGSALGESAEACRVALVKLSESAPMFELEEDTATFAPPLLRDAVLETMDVTTRQHWHARTAEALVTRSSTLLPCDAPSLAHHRLGAGEPALAQPILGLALGHLVCTHRHAEVVALARATMEHREALDPRIVADSLGAQALALEALGRREEERASLDMLRAHTSEHGLSMDAPTLDAWGRLQLVDGQLAEARRTFEAQLEAADRAGQTRYAVRARRSLAGIALTEGRDVEARHGLERCLILSRSLSDPREVVDCYAMLARAHTQRGDGSGALRALTRQVHAAERSGDNRQRAHAYGGLAHRAMLTGRFTSAQTHLDRQLRLARQAHAQGSELRALRGLGYLHTARGHLSAASGLFESAILIAQRSGREVDVTRLWIDRAMLAGLAGDTLAVMRMGMRALSRAQRLGAAAVEVAALTLVGDAALERQETDEARDWYAQALGVARARRACAAPLRPLLGQARLARDEGDLDQLAALLEEVRGLAAGSGRVGIVLVSDAVAAAELGAPSATVLRSLVLDGARLTVLERLEVWIDLAAATGDDLFARYARETVIAIASDLEVTPAQLAAGTRLYRRVPGFEHSDVRSGATG